MVLRKRTIMHYTSYMEDCCISLSQRMDVSSDELIAPFVEIQVLQRKISDAFSYHDVSTCDIRGERAIHITVDSFSRELDELKKSISSTANKNAVLVHHLHFMEVWIHEVALYNELWQSTFVPARLTQPETKNHLGQTSMQRTNMLWQLVTATVSFHSWCLSAENAELLYFPFSWWAKQSYVFIVQVKTVCLDGGGAGLRGGKAEMNIREHHQTASLEADFRRAAEKELMINHTLQLYIEKLATLTTQLVDDDGNRDMFFHHGFLLKAIKSGYESRIGFEENRPATPAGGQFDTQQQEQSSSSLSQLSYSELRDRDLQASMLPAVSTNDRGEQLEINDPHTHDYSSSAASQPLDLQFDLAAAEPPGFDEIVWDTMMEEFSFFTPQPQNASLPSL